MNPDDMTDATPFGIARIWDNITDPDWLADAAADYLLFGLATAMTVQLIIVGVAWLWNKRYRGWTVQTRYLDAHGALHEPVSPVGLATMRDVLNNPFEMVKFLRSACTAIANVTFKSREEAEEQGLVRIGGAKSDKRIVVDFTNVDPAHVSWHDPEMKARAQDAWAQKQAKPPRPPKTIFVTRHPGAVDWAARHGHAGAEMVAHLDPGLLVPGDRVLGTLPVHVAHQAIARGASYHHLRMDVPADLRGQDLDAEQMEALGARLEPYDILKRGG